MFHIMLILPILFIAAIVLSILLFSIFTLVLSIIGGTSVAVYVKDQKIKRMLFIGFCILSFFALIFIVPFIFMYANFSASLIIPSTIFIGICISILSIIEIRYSATIENKVVRTVLFIIFGFILALAISFLIIFPILIII